MIWADYTLIKSFSSFRTCVVSVVVEQKSPLKFFPWCSQLLFLQDYLRSVRRESSNLAHLAEGESGNGPWGWNRPLLCVDDNKKQAPDRSIERLDCYYSETNTYEKWKISSALFIPSPIKRSLNINCPLPSLFPCHPIALLHKEVHTVKYFPGK